MKPWVCTATVMLGMLCLASTATAADALLSGELRYVPRSAALVTFVDLARIRTAGLDDVVAPLRQRSLSAASDLERLTGLRLDPDTDHAVVGVSDPVAGAGPREQIAIVRGRFEVGAILATAQAHGGVPEAYRGARALSFQDGRDGWLMAAPESSLLVFGTPSLVHQALDASVDSAARWLEAPGVDIIVASVSATPAWVVGRTETAPASAPVPTAVLEQLPPLDWIAAAVQTEPGYRGLLSAEARDDAGVERLREVLNGLVALARVQGAQRPEWRTALGSLRPEIHGKLVSISVELTRDLLARLASGGVLR